MSDPIERLMDHDTPVLVTPNTASDVYHIPLSGSHPVEMACGRVVDRAGIRSLSTLLRTSGTRLCDHCWPEDAPQAYPFDKRFGRVL